MAKATVTRIDRLEAAVSGLTQAGERDRINALVGEIAGLDTHAALLNFLERLDIPASEINPELLRPEATGVDLLRLIVRQAESNRANR